MSFIQGIIYECFIDCERSDLYGNVIKSDDDLINFKTKCMDKALSCLQAIDEQSRDNVTSEFVGRIRRSTLNNHSSDLYHQDQQKTIKALEDISSRMPSLQVLLGELTETIKNIEVPGIDENT